MNRTVLTAIGIVVVVLGILAASAVFTVHQTQQALVVQFGEPRQVIREPGLHFKIPFIQEVKYFDARVLDFGPPAEEVIAADQKRLVVDTYARYKITDPLRFFQTVGTEMGVESRLGSILNSSLRRVVGSRSLASVLSDERSEMVQQIREGANQATREFGIDVIDVRIRRADLPEANAQAIFRRMQSEREREAREFRAQGAELAQRIRARAERERTVLVADAQRQSQTFRGEGDSEAIKIYADAFGRDAEFFAFYRAMEAYRNALGEDGTTVVLSPDSDFFRYFGSIGGVATGRTGGGRSE